MPVYLASVFGLAVMGTTWLGSMNHAADTGVKQSANNAYKSRVSSPSQVI